MAAFDPGFAQKAFHIDVQAFVQQARIDPLDWMAWPSTLNVLTNGHRFASYGVSKLPSETMQHLDDALILMPQLCWSWHSKSSSMWMAPAGDCEALKRLSTHADNKNGTKLSAMCPSFYNNGFDWNSARKSCIPAAYQPTNRSLGCADPLRAAN